MKIALYITWFILFGWNLVLHVGFSVLTGKFWFWGISWVITATIMWLLLIPVNFYLKSYTKKELEEEIL